MKKLLLIIIASISTVCCSIDNSKLNDPIDIQIIEEYKPDISKEIYLTRSGIQIEKIDSTYILESDIILTDEQVELLGLPEGRGTILGEHKYMWPYGVVYYYIPMKRGGIDYPKRAELKAAMNYFHRTTGVEFRHVTFPGNIWGENYIMQKDYIKMLSSSNESWSNLGRIGGQQQLCLASWATTGTAIHELGHAIGLLHEHTKRDRDSHINVIYSNIKPDERHNYEIVTQAQNRDLPFDYNSIMIYGSYSTFAIDAKKPTMTKKDGSIWNAQRKSFSPNDLNIIKQKYPNRPCNIILP